MYSCYTVIRIINNVILQTIKTNLQSFGGLCKPPTAGAKMIKEGNKNE